MWPIWCNKHRQMLNLFLDQLNFLYVRTIKKPIAPEKSTCLRVAGRRSEGMKVTPWEGRLPPGEELQPPREEPPLAQGVDTTADSQ